MPEYGILNTEYGIRPTRITTFLPSGPKLGLASGPWHCKHAAVGLNSGRPFQRYMLLDTQWHVRILVSVFGKFQIETDFAPLAFVCGGGDEGEWGRVWPIFRQSKC